MEDNTNEVKETYTPEEVEQGLFQDLLDYLVGHNLKNEHQFYDIHITSDGYCTIVEWKDIGYEYQYEEGRFKYVPSNGYVMLEYHFPDNHYEMFESEEEYQEALKLWLEKNPGWVKTPYGTWTNEIENEKFRKEMEREENQGKTKEKPIEDLDDDLHLIEDVESTDEI